MKKTTYFVMVLLLSLISVIIGSAAEEDSDMEGLWYLGTTNYGSSYVISTELILRTDHTIEFINDDSSKGTWEHFADSFGKDYIDLSINSGIGYSKVRMYYDELESMYKADYLGLYYTLSRTNPIRDLNVAFQDKEVLEDYVGVWLPQRLFVSGVEMSVRDVLADDLKVAVSINEDDNPVIHLYQDNDIEDKADEKTIGEFSNSEIHYYMPKSSEDNVNERQTDEELAKYSGVINLRVDNYMYMTMEYKDTVKVEIILSKDK